MKIHPALFVLLLFAGCEPVYDDTQPVVMFVDHVSPAPFDVFERPGKTLQDGIDFRAQRLDHLEIRRRCATRMTSQELLDQLLAHQDRIERVIEASATIEPRLPRMQELKEKDVMAGRHLDSVQIRLFNNSRVLLADATRCWSEQDYEGCRRRYVASLQLGLCLMSDADERNHIWGVQIIGPSLLELDARTTDGLSERITRDQCRELGRLVVRAGDLWPVTRKETLKVGKAWKRLDGIFNVDDHDHDASNLAMSFLLPPLSTEY